MKRGLVLGAVLLALTTGYFGIAHFSGGAFPTCGLPIGGEEAELRAMALRFWEDVRFKDYEHASSYHTPEKQGAVDIPFLIQRAFLIKPEALDIMEHEVVSVDLDSTRHRARVKTRLKYKVLTNGGIEEREIMLYYTRDSDETAWYMKLEDSLRTPEADTRKKHK